MLLILIFLLNLIVATFLFYNFYYKRRNLPPGPTPLPLVGNLWTIMKNQPGDGQFLKWSREYGPIYTYWVGEVPVVCITDFNKIIETFQKTVKHMLGATMLLKWTKSLKAVQQVLFLLKEIYGETKDASHCTYFETLVWAKT